jgi:hypothetical protein
MYNHKTKILVEHKKNNCHLECFKGAKGAYTILAEMFLYPPTPPRFMHGF